MKFWYLFSLSLKIVSGDLFRALKPYNDTFLVAVKSASSEYRHQRSPVRSDTLIFLLGPAYGRITPKQLVPIRSIEHAQYLDGLPLANTQYSNQVPTILNMFLEQDLGMGYPTLKTSMFYKLPSCDGR